MRTRIQLLLCGTPSPLLLVPDARSGTLHKYLIRLFSLVCEGSKICILYPLTVLQDTSSVAALPFLVFLVVVCTILHAVLLISVIFLGLVVALPILTALFCRALLVLTWKTLLAYVKNTLRRDAAIDGK